MKNYSIDKKYKIQNTSPSKGCQEKYVRNAYWYKVDGSCNEGANEHIVSLLLQCSSIDDFVYYERCKVNNKLSCRSKSFLNENEIYIDLASIIDSVENNSSSDYIIQTIPNILDRFNYIVNVVRIFTHGQIDYRYMLSCIIYLDMFILNRDRHLGNFGVVVNTITGSYRPAPIFDNGLSLLGGCQGYVFEQGLESTIQSQTARTISGSFQQQAYYCTGGVYRSPFKINFNRFFKLLENEEVSKLMYDTIMYQYNVLHKIYE